MLQLNAKTIEINAEVNRICRLCASLKKSNHFIKLQDANHEVCLKLAKCCQIQILLSDALPKFVCHECVQLLNQSYAFYNKVYEAQDILAALFPSDDVLSEKPSTATDNYVERGKNVTSDIVTEIFDNHVKSKPEPQALIELHKSDVHYDQLNEDSAGANDTLNTVTSESSIPEETFAVAWSALERQEKIEKNVDPVVTTNSPHVNSDHIAEHTANRNGFICELCGSTFHNQCHFLMHIRRHTGDKQFSCEFCSSKFYNNSELNRHLRTHTGEKPYECKYCHRKFTDSSTQVKHERTHTKERPYKCDICNKSFTHANTLKSHKLIHTGERLFSCTQCKRSFQQKKHLIKHFQSLTHIKKSL